MSTGQGQQPSEEELRAAYEAEIKKLKVEHLLLEHVVTLVNLGMRRTGLAPGTEGERDPDQVRLAIDAVRAVLPLVERAAPEQVKPIRDAVSQLQIAYVKIGGAPGEGAAAGAEQQHEDTPAPSEPQKPGGDPGPAQRSGKLWVPGQ